MDGGGDGVEQAGEIRETARLVVLTASLQLVGEGDEVSRLALVVEIENRAIDETVGDGVEVFRPQEGRHSDDGVPVDEETAEHRLLRLHIVRRQSFDDAWYSGDHGSPRPCDGSPNTTAGSPAGRRTKRDATGPRRLPSRPANSRRDGVKPSLRLADRVELLFDLDTLPGLLGQGGGAAFIVDETMGPGNALSSTHSCDGPSSTVSVLLSSCSEPGSG